jgi:trimethylamine--corrinoid protein Co-methyltransferase
VGLVETAQCLYHEQMIIDEEIFGFMQRIKAGIKGGRDYIFSDLISRIGAGGQYLSEESTVQLLREGEHYITKLVNRESFEKWQDSSKKDLRQVARERAKEILQAPRKEYLSAEIVKDLEKVLVSAEKALCS